MSAPEMVERDDKYLPSAKRSGSIPEKRNGKPWEVSDVEAEAEKRVKDEGHG